MRTGSFVRNAFGQAQWLLIFTSLACTPTIVRSTVPTTQLTSVSAIDSTRPAASGPTVEVTVEHLANDSWRVAYKLPEPVRALRFLVQERASRLKHWKYLEPEGLNLMESARDESLMGERLARANGSAFEQVVLEITPDTEMPEKAYIPAIRFADDGVLFYTAQLNVALCIDGVACAHPMATVTRFTFVPRYGESVVLASGGKSVPAQWTGPDKGTYVYFGGLAAVETPFVKAVVDRGLPSWLRARIDDLLPKVFEYYANKIGYRLTKRPLVFMTYRDEPKAGTRSIGGGTLSGIVLFDIRLGEHFQSEDDPALAHDIAHLVAHEAAHCWNSQMFANASEERGGDWIHEGGADAFADRALRHLGIYSREKYRARLSEALSLCALGLRGVPLSASSQPGRSKNWYSCGSSIALWTEAVLSTAKPNEDLFGFWRQLFDAAVDHRYDEKLYYRMLAMRVPDAATQIRHFVEDPIENPSATLTYALSTHGVGLDADDSAATPKYFDLVAIRAAEIAAGGDECEDVQAETRWKGVFVQARSCRTLPGKMEVAAIGDNPLPKNAPQAWDTMASRCAAAGTIEIVLTGEDRRRVIACPQTVPQRPRYLKITDAPFD